MLNITNNTPFVSEITTLGEFRILSCNPLTLTSEINHPPPWKDWFSEWLHVLINGPLYKSMSFCVDRWSQYTLTMASTSTATMTMGFADARTIWSRHAPGVFEWDGSDLELTIACHPGNANLTKPRYGPAVATDIRLSMVLESENPTWKVLDAPITTVQYNPSFNHAYYKKP
jgi:hypothetical protein